MRSKESIEEGVFLGESSEDRDLRSRSRSRVGKVAFVREGKKIPSPVSTRSSHFDHPRPFCVHWPQTHSCHWTHSSLEYLCMASLRCIIISGSGRRVGMMRRLKGTESQVPSVLFHSQPKIRSVVASNEWFGSYGQWSRASSFTQNLPSLLLVRFLSLHSSPRKPSTRVSPNGPPRLIQPNM